MMSATDYYEKNRQPHGQKTCLLPPHGPLFWWGHPLPEPKLEKVSMNSRSGFRPDWGDLLKGIPSLAAFCENIYRTMPTNLLEMWIGATFCRYYVDSAAIC